ncbi:MAG: hypothetical protein ACRDKE_06010, partial [Solirubrobacterales bacterium]
AFTSSESSATFTCALDGAVSAACTSPAQYSGLAEGAHSFVLTGRDAVGNTSTVTRSFIVDISPPSLTITNPIEGAAIALSQVSVEFASADAAATFTCSRDGSFASACTSPRLFSNFPDGPHTVSVTARDAAGNTSSVARSFVIDTTGPPLDVSSPAPNEVLPAQELTAVFASSEATATLLCSLDGAVAEACSSPKQYSGLAGGQHELKIAAVDALGNRTEVTRTFLATAPTMPPLTIAASCTQSNFVASKTAIDCSFSSPNELVSSQCSVTGPGANYPLADCTSPISYSTGEGALVFTVSGTDVYGQSATTTRTINVFHGDGAVKAVCVREFSGISCTWDAGPSGPSTCSMSGPNPSPGASCSQPKAYYGLNPGNHTFKVCVNTGFGVNCSSVPITVASDAAPTVTPGCTRSADGTEITCNPTASESAAFRCTFGGITQACTGPATWSGLSSTTNYTMKICGTDTSSQTSCATQTLLAVPLKITASCSTAQPYTADCTWTKNKALSFVACGLWGPLSVGQTGGCTSPLHYAGLLPGAYQLVISGTSAVGEE